MLAIPAHHAMADQNEIDLAELANEPLILCPRSLGSTFYDTIMDACRKFGFEPHVAQFAPQIASIVNLVAGELGFSMVPACMSQLRVAGVIFREIRGQGPKIRLALAHRRSNTSKLVRDFVAAARGK